MRPIVAIIGRPNVGKSTLFNAISKRRFAIVDDFPGVTRDRNYIDVSWEDKNFILVDTGGFDFFRDDDLTNRVKEHAAMAVEEAEVVILLLDAKEGLMHDDIDLSKMINKYKKPVLYVVNKSESKAAMNSVAEFYEMGCDCMYPISAKNRIGLNELMAEVCRLLPSAEEGKKSDEEVVVSIIGRPNVGKSSIINRLLGYERLIVSKTAGTTRDSVDTVIRYKNKSIRFIDTAGIRRKSRINIDVEKFSVIHAMKSISRSSISLFIVDAVQGVSSQDARLAAQIYDRNKACILVINKWDLVEKDPKTHEKFVTMLRTELAFLDFAPVITVSALTGFRVRKILDIIDEISNTYNKKIPTPQLNREIRRICEVRTPPKGLGGRTKIFYAAQIDTVPPTLKIFTNHPKSFPRHYRKYMERAIREKFELDGLPVYLKIIGKNESRKK